jgi:hypothetical protein
MPSRNRETYVPLASQLIIGQLVSMASKRRSQFSLKTVLAAMAGICAVLALLQEAGIFVISLAFFWFLVGLLFVPAKPRVRTVAVCLGLGVIAGITALLDLAVPIVVSIRSALASFAVGFSFAVPLIRGPCWSARAAALATYLVWLLLLPHASWDPRKPFWRAYGSIEKGMTRQEVEELLRRQFDGRVPDHKYDARHWFFYLNSNNGRYDSEIIAVDISKGRVENVAYWPD